MRATGALLLGLALSVTICACGSGSSAGTSASKPASTAQSNGAAARFLAGYVSADGRVIRHDQGGDIVSEGQAYGMLIAELAHRPSLARTIWSWTRAHLQRADGLLASHADGDGKLLDPHSATDGDILTAYALLRYAGPGQAQLHSAGRRLAGAVLANEAVKLPDGALLPVAGPWARTTSPPVVDPSYLMPGIFAALAGLTGDARWHAAARASVTAVSTLTGGGSRLPSDWASLSGGRLTPIPAPGGAAPVQYGPDAARLPIWFAAACDTDARRLAADWWRNVLRTDDRSVATVLSLSGATIDEAAAP
ncbi:MAG: glycosyl hydrolase family 8, partial [Solirubrobacteraceae bacterium]